MNLKILFFASLREQFEFSQKEITLLKEVRTAEEFLLDMSKQSGGEWVDLFENKSMYKLAINKSFLHGKILFTKEMSLQFFHR